MDEKRVIQNIKAVPEFNCIRNGEPSNELFIMQTKARVKQTGIPDLRLPNGNLTADSKSQTEEDTKKAKKPRKDTGEY